MHCMKTLAPKNMLPPEIDPVDVRIVSELQADAKLTNVELAARVHLSPSPCLTRVRSLEERGVINRCVALLDPHSVGLHVRLHLDQPREYPELVREQLRNATYRRLGV